MLSNRWLAFGLNDLDSCIGISRAEQYIEQNGKHLSELRGGRLILINQDDKTNRVILFVHLSFFLSHHHQNIIFSLVGTLPGTSSSLTLDLDCFKGFLDSNGCYFLD